MPSAGLSGPSITPLLTRMADEEPDGTGRSRGHVSMTLTQTPSPKTVMEGVFAGPGGTSAQPPPTGLPVTL